MVLNFFSLSFLVLFCPKLSFSAFFERSLLSFVVLFGLFRIFSPSFFRWGGRCRAAPILPLPPGCAPPRAQQHPPACRPSPRGFGVRSRSRGIAAFKPGSRDCGIGSFIIIAAFLFIFFPPKAQSPEPKALFFHIGIVCNTFPIPKFPIVGSGFGSAAHATGTCAPPASRNASASAQK